MKDYTLEDLTPYLTEHSILGNAKNIHFNCVKPAFECDSNSLAWINPARKDKQAIFENCLSNLIIIDDSIFLSPEKLDSKCLIVVANPRLVFTRILNGLFLNNSSYCEYGTIHSSSVINPEAIIHPSVTIGPFNVIGKCEIGEGTYIGANNTIHDNVVIGENVRINEYNLLGGAGLGFVKDEDGRLIKIAHIGTLIIEDDVEIFTHVNIDRGTLAKTTIKKGAKIDHHVHIGHNCTVGENTVVVAHTVMCGGSELANNVWAGVGSYLKDAIFVGEGTTLGMGAVVTKNVPGKEVWVGNPAQKLDSFLAQSKKIKTL
jgi:UDP-3-O-[3-hydroxymyristoyl] glucosamine N-acyltransferase